MTTRNFFITLLAMLAFTGNAPAALNAYEPFAYTTGPLANGTAATGTGFSGSWTCGSPGTIGAGLTYSGLPVANNALSSGYGRQFVSLANPLSSGTKWISFLYHASGNMGANADGVFFPNGNSTCLWFGFGTGPYSPTQGQLGIASMTTAGTAAQPATPLKQVGLGSYGATHMIALKIDFNTSGAYDTITIYTNPIANTSAPGVNAAGTHSTYDVGTISGVGLNVQGAATITVDEIRIGDTYSEVSGGDSTPPEPVSLAASINRGAGITWFASNSVTYQVQWTSALAGTNTVWHNLGGLIPGNGLTNTVFDPVGPPHNHYQVLSIQ